MGNPKIDVLPSLEDMLRGPLRQDELTKVVQKEVAKIMAERDALVFEPFFRSRQVAYELKRLQTVSEQKKFTIGYKRYGCIDCKTEDRRTEVTACATTADRSGSDAWRRSSLRESRANWLNLRVEFGNSGFCRRMHRGTACIGPGTSRTSHANPKAKRSPDAPCGQKGCEQ
jgi:hypothetical protein